MCISLNYRASAISHLCNGISLDLRCENVTYICIIYTVQLRCNIAFNLAHKLLYPQARVISPMSTSHLTHKYVSFHLRAPVILPTSSSGFDRVHLYHLWAWIVVHVRKYSTNNLLHCISICMWKYHTCVYRKVKFMQLE